MRDQERTEWRKEVKRLQSLTKRLKKKNEALRKEIVRLREALTFYAAKRNEDGSITVRTDEGYRAAIAMGKSNRTLKRNEK